MEKHIKVTFQPEGRGVYVLPGTSLYETACEAGIIIESPCGSEGTCGKCRVIVHRGKTSPNSTEEELVSKEDLRRGVRLACQTRVSSGMVIEVPSSSRFSAQRILTSDVLSAGREVSQRARKKGSASAADYGVAFDLGTTTVVGTLMDLNTGQDIAVCARMNPQVVYGDDVISRIHHSIQSENGLEDLHGRIIEEFNSIIGELARSAGINRVKIYRVTVAGNSTMQHIFLNVSPRSLGFVPFAPLVKESVETDAEKAGLTINPKGKVFVFPSIAGFVGGDTVAVILAARLYRGKSIRLAVDIGTNGEIVLGNEDRLVCASTAAGPAFEGARISCGMRGTGGAIEKVVFNDDVNVNVIDNLAPAGICGSGLLDAAAEMLRAGILDETGRMLARSEIPAGTKPAIAERITEKNGGRVFTLANNPRTNRSVDIIQRDLRELQLAKGAISSGIKILEKELGITDKDIGEVLLAGAFGNYIRRENAREIGLLPDIPLEKIKFIGNAASSGAKIALLSEEQRRKAGEIARWCEYVELSSSADFQNEFASSMFFNKK